MLICVCLRILASSRIPRYDLGRQNPSFLRWFCHIIAPLHIQRRHPPQQMIDILHERVTRSKSNDSNSVAHSTFIATFEPKDISHALTDKSWINAMHEELKNFEQSKV
jgi:hypothetical protein